MKNRINFLWKTEEQKTFINFFFIFLHVINIKETNKINKDDLVFPKGGK